MRKSAAWRGSPIATTKKDFMPLLRSIKLSKEKDVFFDIGCGYGRVCMWVAPRVKLVVGYENHYDRWKVAKERVRKSGNKNIVIKRADFTFASFKKATIVYSMVDPGLHVVARINRQSRRGTRYLQYLRPNYPLKSKRIAGEYYLLSTPFQRVKDPDEFARIILDRKSATIDDLYKKSGREDRLNLKREIDQADSAWKELFLG